MDPPPSLPKDKLPAPAATAAAAPPDEPPGVLLMFQGLRVCPYKGELFVPLRQNSGQVVFAKITAPASSSCRIEVQVSVGTNPARVGNPFAHLTPANHWESFTVIGNPHNAPASPLSSFSSETIAAFLARSWSSSAKGLIFLATF